MEVQRVSSNSPSKEVPEVKKSQGSKKSKPRWECQSVKCVPINLKTSEWEQLLATLAREMYDLSHQLPDVTAFK